MKDLTESEAQARRWMFNSKGVLVASRTDVQSHQRPLSALHL